MTVAQMGTIYCRHHGMQWLDLSGNCFRSRKFVSVLPFACQSAMVGWGFEFEARWRHCRRNSKTIPCSLNSKTIPVPVLSRST